MQMSKLIPYAVGIVAVNKPLTTTLIEVTPIEDLNFLNGEITDNIQDSVTKGLDSKGSSFESSVQVGATINAQWLPIGISNRVTAPDVRRGEKVIIYKYADVDMYYWTTLTYDMRLRKLETVIYAFSATQEENEVGKADNTYFFEVSTHKKTITLHTSKANDEPFIYDIQLNTNDGSFILQDDIGNFISLDSKNVRLEMKNSDGSWIDIDRKNINIYAPNNINIKADNEVNIVGGKKINETSPNINTRSNQTFNTVNQTITTGPVNFRSNLVVNMTTTTSGLISVQSAGSSSGGSINAGSVNVSGGGQFAGTVTVGKLISQQSISAPNV